MSHPINPDADAIVAAYLAGMPRDAIVARFGCGKNTPAILAKRAGVYHLRPAPVRPKRAPILRPKISAKPSAPSMSNRIAISAAHRAPATITLPSLRFLTEVQP